MKHNCTVYINTPENQEKSWTALDEAKTAELWAKAEPRYVVSLTIDEISGFRDVIVGLFHSCGSMSDKEMASLVVLAPDRVIENVSHWYTGTAIEDTFSKVEVSQLHAYFKQLPDVHRIRVRRANPPDNHMMGYGAIPAGGLQDFLSFYKDPDYPLVFKVEGYYDLREY